MARISTPKAPVAPKAEPAAPEAPAAPDISQLIGKLSPLFAERKQGEEQLAGNSLSIIIAMREFRAENPGLERNDCKLALQTTIAEKYNLRLAQVQGDKNPKDKGYSAYTLVSSLLSAAWPKGEKEEKKVAKALADGKGYVEVRKAASKPQTARADQDTRRITVENFATKLATFLTQTQVDTALSMPDVLDMAASAIEAIRKSPGGEATSETK